MSLDSLFENIPSLSEIKTGRRESLLEQERKRVAAELEKAEAQSKLIVELTEQIVTKLTAAEQTWERRIQIIIPKLLEEWFDSYWSLSKSEQQKAEEERFEKWNAYTRIYPNSKNKLLSDFFTKLEKNLTDKNLKVFWTSWGDEMHNTYCLEIYL